MCECGCGETRPLVKLPAPKGGWYALEVYPGCENCGNEFWGLTVTLIKKGDEFADVVENVERITFNEYGQWNQVILDYGMLRKRFVAAGADEDELAEPEEDVAPMFLLNEMIRHGGMAGVFYDTLKKTEEERHTLDGELPHDAEPTA